MSQSNLLLKPRVKTFDIKTNMPIISSNKQTV